MTPQELKNSILQLAIQGKLVPQIPEEGTAEELYQLIQAEKQKLIKEGKIKKEKKLPEITEDEKPFEIPESWKWVRLGTITYNWGQKQPDKTFCYVDVGSINNQKHILNENETIVEAKDASSRARKIVVFGDVIFATIRPYLQNICIIDRVFSREPIVSTAFAVMHCSVGLYNKFLYYYLLSPSFMSFANATDKAKGVAYPAIGEKDFFAGFIPLPPLAEQKRIVAKIEELFREVDRYGESWEKLQKLNEKFPEDMKKSLLQYAIQGKLVPQIAEEGTGDELYKQLKKYHLEIKPCKDELNYSSMDFDIPDNWKMVELNQLFDFVDYRGKTPNKISEGVFLITASNIKQGYMDYTRKEYVSHEEYLERQSRGITQNGDLLFTTEAPMGNVALCDLDVCSCGQRIITFKPYEMGTVVPALYMYFILSPSFQSQLLDNCTGTTAKGIKADKLKHFLIPLPPLAEQKRIVAKLEELLELSGKLKK